MKRACYVNLNKPTVSSEQSNPCALSYYLFLTLTCQHSADDPVDAPLLDDEAGEEERSESGARHGQNRVQHHDGEQPGNAGIFK